MTAFITSSVLISSIDAGKVRMGGFAPTLATVDASKVRMGGFAPTLATADASKVRMDRDTPLARVSKPVEPVRCRHGRGAAVFAAREIEDDPGAVAQGPHNDRVFGDRGHARLWQDVQHSTAPSDARVVTCSRAA